MHDTLMDGTAVSSLNLLSFPHNKLHASNQTIWSFDNGSQCIKFNGIYKNNSTLERDIKFKHYLLWYFHWLFMAISTIELHTFSTFKDNKICNRMVDAAFKENNW